MMAVHLLCKIAEVIDRSREDHYSRNVEPSAMHCVRVVLYVREECYITFPHQEYKANESESNCCSLSLLNPSVSPSSAERKDMDTQKWRRRKSFGHLLGGFLFHRAAQQSLKRGRIRIKRATTARWRNAFPINKTFPFAAAWKSNRRWPEPIICFQLVKI